MIRIVADFLPTGEEASGAADRALTRAVATMQGSRILAAANDAKDLKASGVDVCDLTVGDYAPEQFKAPNTFLHDVASLVVAGQNQYPPSDGMPELQKAVLAFYERELDTRFPDRSVVVCGGARPPIYAIFRCLVEAGDKVLYFVPSWNNDYYTYLCGATPVVVQTSAETNFFPTVSEVEAHITDPAVRMVSLNSPLNPCGTVIDPEVLRGICQAIVFENDRRERLGHRPVFLMFDMVYWPLTYGDVKFHHPIELCPFIAPYVIYVDAISKWMVGTGLRLGWAVVPTYLYTSMRDFMGHVGGWGPRPVQIATARFLQDPDAFTSFRKHLQAGLGDRLTAVRMFFEGMRAAGIPVESTTPQGAIYLSVRFNVIGKTTPSGQVLQTNTDIRKYLLYEARVALIAFQAFSVWEDTGWFRISVGAVGSTVLEQGLLRLRDALLALR